MLTYSGICTVLYLHYTGALQGGYPVHMLFCTLVATSDSHLCYTSSNIPFSHPSVTMLGYPIPHHPNPRFPTVEIGCSGHPQNRWFGRVFRRWYKQVFWSGSNRWSQLLFALRFHTLTTMSQLVIHTSVTPPQIHPFHTPL